MSTIGNIEPFRIGSHHYLQRAQNELVQGTHASLLYAVLELRCAVEARLREVLEPHPHVSRKEKKAYQIGALESTVSKKLMDCDTGANITLQSEGYLLTLRYIPVSSALRKFAERAGNYLHAMMIRPTDEYMQKIRSEADACAAALEECLGGQLLGPPLVDKRTGKVHMTAELIDGNEDKEAELRRFIAPGKRLICKVEYFSLRCIPDVT